MLAGAGRGRVVVVPGGGPFADRVRRDQRRVGFDDRLAHRRALEAMDEFGRLVARGYPQLVPTAEFKALNRGLQARQVPVWMAAAVAIREPAIPATWAVTSDALAAWLSARLGASHLVLVKSITHPPRLACLSALCASGIVDPAFPAFLAPGTRVWLTVRSGYRDCGAALATGVPAGVAVNTAG